MALSNSFSVLQKYYASYESRIGYALLLRRARHFGYYASANSSSLPIGPALRAMEEKLYQALGSPTRSQLFDAGCGAGHVALYMAERGNNHVHAIDIIDKHVKQAIDNIRRTSMQDFITVRQGDYHHLQHVPSASFDGIYTMETLVHSSDPLSVLQQLCRILKPGGRIALHEYDHAPLGAMPQKYAEAMRQVNTNAAMPGNNAFEYDVLVKLLQDAGFEDIELVDLTSHVEPMMRLFYILSTIPCRIMTCLRLEGHFVNAMAAAKMYPARRYWRYVQVKATKPDAEHDSPVTQ